MLGILENKIRSRVKFFRAQKRDPGKLVELGEEESPPEDLTRPTRKLIQSEERERLEGDRARWLELQASRGGR